VRPLAFFFHQARVYGTMTSADFSLPLGIRALPW